MKISVNLKHIIYRPVIILTMTYEAECWTMKKKDEMLMNNTEIIMLKWIQVVSQNIIDDNGWIMAVSRATH